jgi:hypothetical protein
MLGDVGFCDPFAFGSGDERERERERTRAGNFSRMPLGKLRAIKKHMSAALYFGAVIQASNFTVFCKLKKSFHVHQTFQRKSPTLPEHPPHYSVSFSSTTNRFDAGLNSPAETQ